ncbi:hypothetical protein CASFOL_039380 [Castilleja foliolosa]|uniref:Uncharacterized protein n=1 Tax=Castilleja foliolosa TaxID=1961234 RepID=A0ABD3BHT5_9LAMI
MKDTFLGRGNECLLIPNSLIGLNSKGVFQENHSAKYKLCHKNGL